MTMTKVLAAAAIIGAAAIGSVQAQHWESPRHHGMTTKVATDKEAKGKKDRKDQKDKKSQKGKKDQKAKKSQDSEWACALTNRENKRLVSLKADLKITPAQEALWENYAAVARSSARSLVDRCRAVKTEWENAARTGMPKPTLPERLDAYAGWLEVQLEGIRARADALRPLYDAMSAKQKKKANELIRG